MDRESLRDLRRQRGPPRIAPPALSGLACRARRLAQRRARALREILGKAAQLADLVPHPRHGSLRFRIAEVQCQFKELKAEADIVENIAEVMRDLGGETVESRSIGVPGACVTHAGVLFRGE